MSPVVRRSKKKGGVCGIAIARVREYESFKTHAYLHTSLDTCNPIVDLQLKFTLKLFGI